MDPLSVIASVAGIITAASEAIRVLGPYVTAAAEAPRIASQVLSEVLAVKTIVAALEQFAINISSGTGSSRVQYASLIQVDQLLAVLTDGVLVFSDLEALLQSLPPNDSGSRGRLLSSMQWVRKKGALAALCTRLQAFKLSINCILSILQSDSQVRAEDHQKKLLSNMDALLKSNEALAHIFLGAGVPQASISWSQRLSVQPEPVPPAQDSPEPSTNRRSLFDLPFEKDLKASRVYRRIKRDTMDFSMRSSVARSLGWSIFSGMSLSDISEISVLALPIHLSDISNPQHYADGAGSHKAGKLSNLPSLYTSSLFHECVELRAYMYLLKSRLSSFVLSRQILRVQQELEAAGPFHSDPLSVLISLFRLGTPLLQLYDQLDDSIHERWEPFLYQVGTAAPAKLAVMEFIQACVSRQGIQAADCFTVSDLMGDDTTNHIKVIRLVRQIVSRLVDAGKMQPVDVDSLPDLQAQQGPPSPQSLAIDELLREERAYVARLEILPQARDQIVRLHGIVLAGDMEAADHLLSISRPLLDTQRRLLLRLERLALSTYSGFDRPWLQLFQHWSDKATDLYAQFVSREKQAKSAFLAALALKAALSPAADVPDELKDIIGDVIAVISLPSQRLDKYAGFLTEIAQHDNRARAALETVENVVKNSCLAKDAVDRDDAKAALLSSLDEGEKSAVGEYGDLLLFEDAVSITGEIRGSKYADPFAQLYFFERALLHVVLAKKPARIRRAENSSINLKRSIKHTLRSEDLRSISTRVQDSIRGFEVAFPRGKWIVELTIGSRCGEWVNVLTEVRDKAHKLRRAQGFEHYRIAITGGMGSGRERFKTQFLVPHTPAQFESEGWYLSTQDVDRKELVIGDETYTLEILEPSHEELSVFSAMKYAYMRESDGFLLIYSVNNRYSFEDISTTKEQILRVKDKDTFPMVIVGNDCLQSGGPTERRQVGIKEGQAFAKRMGCPFIEADARTGFNVEEAFAKLVQEINTSSYKDGSYGYA